MRERIKELLKQNRGMALLIVLCLFAILLGLGFSVFFASVTSVKTTTKEIAAEQVYFSAYSACEVIKDQLITKSGREDTELKKKLSALAVGEKVSITSNLPGNMGEIEGEFKVPKDSYGILRVTASQNTGGLSPAEVPAAYTLYMIFARDEQVIDPDIGTVQVEWRFERYVPVSDLEES